MAAITEIPGVGPVMARALEGAGFTDAAAVAGATEEALCVVRGVGPAKAAAMIAAARNLPSATPADVGAEPGGKAKKAGKKKGAGKSGKKAKAAETGKKSKKDKSDKKSKKKDKSGGKKKSGKKKSGKKK